MLTPLLNAVYVVYGTYTAEYNHLLSSQLDSQRQYFEGLLAAQAEEAEERLAAAGSSSAVEAAAREASQAAARDVEKKRQALEKKLVSRW